jgi:membrane protease YdiL (CAAX protease family)
MEAALRRDGAIHGAVYLTALTVALIAMSPLRWPWYLVLPLLAYVIVVVAWPRLRRTAPRLALGRMVGWPLAVALVLAITTVVALLGFQALARPEVAGLAAGLPVAAFGSLLVAGVCFSTTNAVLEELTFRGVLWEATAAEWNRGVALGATTILFGLGHVHGYPPGPLGAVLAGIFGMALGLLRLWTGGLGLAILVHICADATIFTLLVRSEAFEPVAG